MSNYCKLFSIMILSISLCPISIYAGIINLLEEPRLEFLVEAPEGMSVIDYVATLYNARDSKVGNIRFSFNTATFKGRIHNLHIEKSERRKTYGSILLRFALDTLTENKASEITWTASPFSLNAYENHATMLPKLIAFYQRHGAHVLDHSYYNAEMIYYPSH